MFNTQLLPKLVLINKSFKYKKLKRLNYYVNRSFIDNYNARAFNNINILDQRLYDFVKYILSIIILT